MRVMVTGGTGFSGSHTVRHLVNGGHEVHMLVRSPDRIAPALEPLRVEGVSHTVGDVTDAGSVEAAMEGCDAVVHSASVFTLDKRRAAEIRRVTVLGTEVVLGTAQRLELDPIVHVSSIAALFPPDGQVLTAQSLVKNPDGIYIRSKADSERVARKYQDQGAPVVTTYPGVVWGTHDPHWGEGPQLVSNILKGQTSMIPQGGLPIVDVRDVAKVHAAVMEPGRGPRRYMIGGTYMPFGETINAIAELTGRKIRFATLPTLVLVPAVRVVDAIQSILPFRIPINREGFEMVVMDPHCDDSQTINELGIETIPFEDTLSDMVRWMYQSGGISAKLAGKLADD